MHVLALLLCALLLVLLLYHQFVLRRRHLPPGPIPLPIVGNALQIDFSNIVQWCQRMGKQYDGMFTVFFGPTPAVFITDLHILKEAFIAQGDSFADRTDNLIVDDLMRKGKYGLIVTNGAIWRSHRRFALRTLRDFGVSRSLMEDKINYDVQRLTEHIKATIEKGDEVDISINMSVCIASVIANLVLGERYDYDDVNFAALRDMLDEVFSVFTTKTILLQEFPWLQHVPLFGHCGYDDIRAVAERMNTMFGEILQRRLRRLSDNVSNEAEDYVEAFVNERRLRTERGEDADGDGFSDWQLHVCALDLWAAGWETTVTTLRWAVGYMCDNTHIQDRVHSEIVDRIGPASHVAMSDKQLLPYTNAVINEVQRMANILVLNVPRMTTEDVTLRGYHIKKGTMIQGAISAILWSEELYPNATTFDPDRFMADNNKYASDKNPIDALVPFSIGKRACLGEPLARMELFLIFATLMQQFKFEFATDEDRKGFRRGPTGFVVNKPYNYKVNVTVRK